MLHVRLVGGGAKFRSFLAKFAEVEVFASLEALLDAEMTPGMLCVLMPRYDEGQRIADEPGIDVLYRLFEWKRRGVRFYVEAFPAKNYLSREIFSFFTLGQECHFNHDCILWEGKLLQANSLYYFPTAVHGNKVRTLLAEGGDFLGVNSPVRDPSRHYPVLLDNGEGCISAFMNLSACDEVFMRPYGLWRSLLTTLWSKLTEAPLEAVERAFDSTWPQVISLSGGRDAEEALAAAVAWHRRCGLMPSEDGSKGILEMFMSADFSRRQNYRTDSVLMTAALFAGVGVYWHDNNLLNTGKALADFLLARHIQHESGFLRWYDHSSVVYANDSAR
ncbi:MAG: hypothetical protein IJT83_15065, partial [Victivallales bacterium]|nr:hypothetical protein [Victivallales bacterium]